MIRIVIRYVLFFFCGAIVDSFVTGRLVDSFICVPYWLRHASRFCKANVVVDALSRKERVKPRRVRVMPMTIPPSIKDKLLAAQYEVSKEKNAPAKMLHGLDQQIEKKEDEDLYFMARIWVPLIGDVRIMIMDEAHAMRYYIHSRSDKMYYNLSDMYLWPCMKRDIATYKALGTRLDMSTAYHPQTDGQTEFFYNNSYHLSIRCAPFEALYGRKCRSLVLYVEIGGSQLIGTKLVQETTNKVVLIKERLKLAGDHQKSYANNRLKPLDVFHASNLKKYLADANLHVTLEGIKADKYSSFS
nr:putative reverse transcriptase domain-containing protein [Tanacetum cinerariifolium]